VNKDAPVGDTVYDWDSRDRLVRVTDVGGSVSEYGYDTQNLRVSMKNGAGERRVLLDGIEEYGEYDVLGSGAQVARYDHDPTRVDALLGQVTPGATEPVKVHPFVDALGSVYGLADGGCPSSKPRPHRNH